MYCQLHGGAGDFYIEIVGKQGIELQAKQPALGEEAPACLMMVKNGDELWVGNDHGFAKQGADFGAADVEDITEFPGSELHPYPTRQPVTKPGAIQ